MSATNHIVWAHVQIRTSDTEPSSCTELRRIYRSKGIEKVRWQNRTYEIHVDPALDVYYLLLPSKEAVTG